MAGKLAFWKFDGVNCSVWAGLNGSAFCVFEFSRLGLVGSDAARKLKFDRRPRAVKFTSESKLNLSGSRHGRESNKASCCVIKKLNLKEPDLRRLAL